MIDIGHNGVPPAFISVSALAGRWSVSVSTIRRLVRSGRILVSRPTKRTLRIPLEAVERAEASTLELGSKPSTPITIIS